jgi:hypothetical protein
MQNSSSGVKRLECEAHHLPASNVQVAGHGSREVACFLFARSEAGTVGSNPNQGMDV